MRRVKPAVLSLCGAVVSFALACGGGHDAANSPGQADAAPVDGAPAAVANAYAALTAGAVDKVPAVIQDLDALVSAQPNNQQALFFSGVMHLWQLGDNLAPNINLSQRLQEANTVLARLDRAHSLAPNDDLALGFDGLANALIGRQLGDSAKVSMGTGELDEGIARIPAYTHFLRALVAADQQDFSTAVSHMNSTLEACGETPDGGAFPYVKGPQPPLRVACNDEGIVPHVFEGFCITFGDFLLMSGAGAEKARAAYQSAQNSPTYAQWPFASELEARIEQADVRAAVYADGGTPDGGLPPWPSSGHLCTGCHQQHP